MYAKTFKWNTTQFADYAGKSVKQIISVFYPTEEDLRPLNGTAKISGIN